MGFVTRTAGSGARVTRLRRTARLGTIKFLLKKSHCHSSTNDARMPGGVEPDGAQGDAERSARNVGVVCRGRLQGQRQTPSGLNESEQIGVDRA